MNDITIINQQTAEITRNIASIKTDILNAATDNNKSLQACISAGEALLAKVDGGMDDELDAEVATYIKKVKATAKAMKDRRSAVTQIFDLVKKGFTTMENMLDAKSDESVIYRLQVARDQYAAKKIEAQRKAEAERQRLLRIEAEKTRLHDASIQQLNWLVDDATANALDTLTSKFRLLTLDNATAVMSEITGFPATIPLADLFAAHKPAVSPELEPAEASKVMRAAYAEVSEALLRSYSETVGATKQELIDTFDSKISELKELKKAEEERKKAEEEAMKAADAQERAAAEAKAKEAENDRRRREAELLAAEEAAKREMQARLAEEAKARDEEERIRRAQAQTQSLFDQAPTISAPVKAKLSYHIEVDNPEGYLAVIQMWWAHEGSKMATDELAKKLGFMVRRCERIKNSEDISIVDANVRYVEDISAK